MGDTIWLQIDEGGEPRDSERDNSIMLRLEKELDALAVKLDVAKPSSFFDHSALEADFEELLEEADPGGEPAKPSWWSAKAGLQSIGALLDELRQHPTAVRFPSAPSKKHWPALLMEELEYCHGALKDAAASDKNFRFLIVS